MTLLRKESGLSTPCDAWVEHLFVMWIFEFLFVCQFGESTLLNIWCFGKQMHLSSTQCAFACLSRALEKNSWILTELHDTHLKKSSSSNGEVTFSGWFHQALFVYSWHKKLHHSRHFSLHLGWYMYCIWWIMYFGLVSESSHIFSPCPWLPNSNF